MAAKQFTSAEWEDIRTTLDADPSVYGLPERVYGSVLLGSFNIRKLGSSRSRSAETWDFLAHILRRFDLCAIQEILDDLTGLQRLMELLGPDFGLVVSDTTGAFPRARGVAERLGFVFNWRAVQRTEIASDISYDRTRVLNTLAGHFDTISPVMKKRKEALDAIEAWERGGRRGTKPKAPRTKMPVFLTFIRQPFCVSFRMRGHPRTTPYEVMAINAHLIFGDYIDYRRQEFEALMEWIRARAQQTGGPYYPNFILLGDLNLDFDKPDNDRRRIVKYMKSFNDESGEEVNVNFPFLDKHRGQRRIFRTNARLTETFDQIGLFVQDKRFPTYRDNPTMGTAPMGPDYGVFNFVELFSQVLKGKSLRSLTKPQRKAFLARFEHKVSDHMPLWLRLRLPVA